MKTITLGRIKQLYAVGELGSFNNRVDTLLTSYRRDHDDTEINFGAGVLVGMNDKQKDLLTKWGFIDPESKFKDGDYIIVPDVGFVQVNENPKGVFNYTDSSDDYFVINSWRYINSRLATPEEIEENTFIKLEVGNYIYRSNPEYGVGKVIKKEKNQVVEWEYTIRQKDGYEYQIRKGSSRHKQIKYATPEQIYSFNRPWNEGIEEAKKYKDGQPCLVSHALGDPWALAYSNGNGQFYKKYRIYGDTFNWRYHLPLNEQTIKNLPINE